MDFSSIGIFDLAEKRLAWADRRQGVLAQNIANSDTPGWQASDLVPFAATLAGASGGLAMAGSGSASAGPARTDPAHLGGNAQAGLAKDTRSRPHQRAPDGNSVAVDEQLTKVAETETTQALTMNLYKKYLGLFRIAIGKA